MGQAADCTPSKIIEFWEVLSFVVVRKCRTFAEAFAWGQGNVDNGNISHQKDWKEKKYRLLTPQNRLKSIKSLNLHPLECTLKGLWHISDLLRTKYWVITGCKYILCSSLTSINIPKSVASIGEYAFSGCSSLTSVVLAEGLRSIGKGAFMGCKNLTTVTIPNSVTEIGDDAFCGCENLQEVRMQRSWKPIMQEKKAKIFSGYPNLKIKYVK